MNTCGSCEFAHIADPKELRIRTCFGNPPQLIMTVRQIQQVNPEGKPVTTMQQMLQPLRPQVAISDFACRHYQRSGRGEKMIDHELDAIAGTMRPVTLGETTEGHS